MKIITPEEFAALEQKDNLHYVGKIRAADYVWVHRSGGDNSSANLECLARDLQGDILVTQTVNDDDWKWASNYLSGKVGMDDLTFVAAGDLYRDSTIARPAQFISNDILEQIEPQLDSLGDLEESYDGYNTSEAKFALLKKATKVGADYVSLTRIWSESYPSGIGPEIEYIIATGTAYKIKQNPSAPKPGVVEEIGGK